ncbi:hypothetical protein H7F15_08170 [Pontibacter sp. Tf4]|uniref:hypothetical protein n=1 Tax=Pontibacter sp. Tf4 TaxID=2761620 RepID=UPI00162A6427|nr:hypothetical protein [Pontibacter sp. Tf4]MBB6611009.1 hypothetical protein [Pontibacter sp. Tf4]
MLKVPHFVKPVKAGDIKPRYASPSEEHESKQIKKLYYQLVSDKEPEEVAI